MILEIYSVLGIEAARNTIIEQLNDVFEDYINAENTNYTKNSIINNYIDW